MRTSVRSYSGRRERAQIFDLGGPVLGEVLFQGLVEAFDLAAGLGMVGPRAGSASRLPSRAGSHEESGTGPDEEKAQPCAYATRW